MCPEMIEYIILNNHDVNGNSGLYSAGMHSECGLTLERRACLIGDEVWKMDYILPQVVSYVCCSQYITYNICLIIPLITCIIYLFTLFAQCNVSSRIDLKRT